VETIPPVEPTRERITRRRHDDIVVLQPLGTLDRGLAGDVREQILEAHAPVIIDLDRCARFEATAIADIITAWPLYRPRFCLACSSPGDRRMMESLAENEDIEVFPSVDEAIAALLAP
jgi:anti-anti-sigma regulatory factor